MFENIDALKTKLDQHRPLSPAIVKNLHEDLIVRWTYHSNAIEGNTLTLLETKVVLEGITVGGKALREHFEVINHRNAIYYVEDMIRKEEPFSEWLIPNHRPTQNPASTQRQVSGNFQSSKINLASNADKQKLVLLQILLNLHRQKIHHLYQK